LLISFIAISLFIQVLESLSAKADAMLSDIAM
jgi:hypothetical protein